MLIQYGQALGDYIYDIFVAKFDFWLAFGLIAQLAFAARFLVQWIASERAGRSIIPVTFWMFSLGGGALLLIYALYRKDPVFIAGQALGLLIYVRNLHFIRRERRRSGTARQPAQEQPQHRRIA